MLLEAAGPSVEIDGTTIPILLRRAFSLFAVSFFMTVIDLAIVNVALPTIGHTLHSRRDRRASANYFDRHLPLGGQLHDR
jgi:hypothetical protein